MSTATHRATPHNLCLAALALYLRAACGTTDYTPAVVCTQTDASTCQGRTQVIEYTEVPSFRSGIASFCGDNNMVPHEPPVDMQVVDWDKDGRAREVIIRQAGGPFRYFKLMNSSSQDMSEVKESENPFAHLHLHSSGIHSCPPLDILRGGCPTGLPPGFAIADWDGDGHLDVLVGDNGEHDGGVLFFRNDGNSTLVHVNTTEHPFANLSFGVAKVENHYRQLQAVDWDGDTDLDLIVLDRQLRFRRFGFHAGIGAIPQARFFERKGHNGPLVELTGRDNPFQDINLVLEHYSALHAADWDGDGDVDLFVVLVGNADNLVKIHYYNRMTAGQLVLRDDEDLHPLRHLRHTDRPTGSLLVPHLQVVDWHGDNVADLLYQDFCSWTARLFSRTADLTLVQLHGSYNRVEGLNVLPKSTPQVVDIDGDGELDIISGSYWRWSWGSPGIEIGTFFKGVGQGRFRIGNVESSPLRGIFELDTARTFQLSMFAVDWNEDNKTDLLVRNLSTAEIELHEAVGPDGLLNTSGTPIGVRLGTPLKIVGRFQAATV